MTLSSADPLRLDHEASDKTNLLSVCFLEYMKEMNSIHSEKVTEISSIARKTLLDDYLVRGQDFLVLTIKIEPKELNPSKYTGKIFSTTSFSSNLSCYATNSIMILHVRVFHYAGGWFFMFKSKEESL